MITIKMSEKQEYFSMKMEQLKQSDNKNYDAIEFKNEINKKN